MIFLATFQSFSCTFTVKYWRANDWRHYFCSFSWIGLGRRQSLLLLGRRDMTKLSILCDLLLNPPQKKIKNGFLDSLPLSHNCPFLIDPVWLATQYTARRRDIGVYREEDACLLLLCCRSAAKTKKKNRFRIDPSAEDIAPIFCTAQYLSPGIFLKRSYFAQFSGKLWNSS